MHRFFTIINKVLVYFPEVMICCNIFSIPFDAYLLNEGKIFQDY